MQPANPAILQIHAPGSVPACVHVLTHRLRIYKEPGWYSQKHVKARVPGTSNLGAWSLLIEVFIIFRPSEALQNRSLGYFETYTCPDSQNRNCWPLTKARYACTWIV